jgi:hypothetical protein
MTFDPEFLVLLGRTCPEIGFETPEHHKSEQRIK